MNSEIMDIILVHTNSQIACRSQNYSDMSATISPTTKEELLALFGLLIFAAIQKDNHLSTIICLTQNYQVQCIRLQ